MSKKRPELNITKALKPFYIELEKAHKDGALDNPTKSLTDRLSRILRRCINTIVSRELRFESSHAHSVLKRGYNVFIKDGFKDTHRGLRGWKLRDLRPKLEKELRARINFSNSLIQLTNSEHSRKINQRFIGWTSSKGEDTSAKGLAEALQIGATFTKARRHQKRVLGDQTRKMLSNFDSIVAEEHKAIAFIWKTRRDNRVVGNPSGKNPKVTNPEVHGDHYHRQDKLYFLHDTWVIKKKLVDTRSKQFAWADFKDGMPGQPINCRCYATYIYDLGDIPEELLTDLGEKYLESQSLSV